MLDKLMPKINELKDKLQDKKIFGSRFENALKKAKETKDAGFFKKLWIFAKTFVTESGEVEKAKAKEKAKASDAVKQGVDETMESTRKAVKLDEVKDEKERQFADEVLAMAVTSYEGMDDDHQQSASSALDKIEAASAGKEAEPLTFEESAAVVSVSFKTLKQLKSRYPKKSDFKDALDKIMRLSDKSSYPLKKLLSSDTLKLFKVSSDEEGLKFLKAFGIEASAGDALGKVAGMFGVDTDVKGAAGEVKELMAGLGKRPIQNKEGIVDFMKKYIFPHTDKSDIGHVAVILNEMITGSGDKIDTTQLSDLVFYLDDQDYDHLITALVGKSNSEVAKLGKAEA